LSTSELQKPDFEPSLPSVVPSLLASFQPSIRSSLACLSFRSHRSPRTLTARSRSTLSSNTQPSPATMPKRAKFAMRISKKSVFLQAQHAHTPGRNQRQSLPQLGRMAAESDLHAAQNPAVQQTQQDEDWTDEEESVSLPSESEDEEDGITHMAPSSDGSENDPPTTRDNVSNQNRAQVHKAPNDLGFTDNNALDVADAAFRQAMWMLRDAHNMRDNIIHHRIAFLQRREEARKDFDLLTASVMESDPHDRMGGRTRGKWRLARYHYRDMAAKAINVHEASYWSSVRDIAMAFIIHEPREARRLLLFAPKCMES
jgi:hypothetical protein